jgi:hypothetical protein
MKVRSTNLYFELKIMIISFVFSHPSINFNIGQKHVKLEPEKKYVRNKMNKI